MTGNPPQLDKLEGLALEYARTGTKAANGALYLYYEV